MYRAILIFFAITSVRSSGVRPLVVNVNPYSSIINCPNICPLLCPAICALLPIRAVNVTGFSNGSPYEVRGFLCETACKKACNPFFPGTDPDPEDQSVKLTIAYNDNESYLEVVEARLNSGKWTKFEDCDYEEPSPDHLKITKDQPARIRACGSKGVQGSFYLQSSIKGVSSKDAYVKLITGSDTVELTNLNTSSPTVLCVLNSNDNSIFCSKLKN